MYQDDLTQALNYANLARDAMSKSVGEDDPNYLIGYINEAIIYKQFGEIDQAIELLLKFKNKYEEFEVDFVSQYLQSFNLLGECYIELAQYDKASTILMEGLVLNEVESSEISTSSRFKSPLDAFKALNMLVNSNILKGNYQQAEDFAIIAKALLNTSKGQFSNQADIITINGLWSETNELLATIYFAN